MENIFTTKKCRNKFFFLYSILQLENTEWAESWKSTYILEFWYIFLLLLYGEIGRVGVFLRDYSTESMELCSMQKWHSFCMKQKKNPFQQLISILMILNEKSNCFHYARLSQLLNVIGLNFHSFKSYAFHNFKFFIEIFLKFYIFD